MLTPKTTHATEAITNMLQQFKGKLKFEALLNAISRQVQDLEDVFFQIVAIVDLNTVTGIQLDTIGIILDQPRNGQNDDTYRLFLKAKILVCTSRGTADDILAILFLLVDDVGVSIEYIEAPDTDMATFEIDIKTDLDLSVDGTVISILTLKAKSAAIRGLISYRYARHFKLDTVGIGFDATGGKLSTTVAV